LQKRQEALDENSEDLSEDKTLAEHQDESIRRLNQLLDAIKGERGSGSGASSEGGGAAASRSQSDQPGRIAELKALQLLQEEVARRTTKFHKAHADLSRLDDADQGELRKLRDAQREVADLLDQLAQTPHPEGDNP
jgi:hypothetical protein